MNARRFSIVLALLFALLIILPNAANAATCPYGCIFVCVEPGHCATLNDFLLADVTTQAILTDAGWSAQKLSKYWDLNSPGIIDCPTPNHWKTEFITNVPLVYVNGALYCKDPAWANRYMAMTDDCDLSHLNPADIMVKPLPSGKMQRYARIGGVPFTSAGFIYSLYVLDSDSNPDNGFILLNCGNFSPPPEKCGKISGHKWKDLDADGTWDKPQEPAIQAWKIILKDSDDQIIAEALTDATGYYEFDTLPVGCYTVEEESRTGYFRTLPIASPVYEICLTHCEERTDIDFGNCPYGCIEGIKWDDADKDGIHDADELPIQGCKIKLQGPGGLLLEQMTGADGSYRFDNLKPGAYTICEDCVLPGCEITMPDTADHCYHITLSGGACLTDKDFGNFCCLGSISGIKYSDNNLNGVLDDGNIGECGFHAETGLPGWKIILKKLDGTPVAETFSGADGTYSFDNLEKGIYVVSEELITGWKQTQPSGGTYTVNINCDDVSGKNFGNVKYASIKGLKAADCDGDGAYDIGETPLSGWEICLQGTAFDGTPINTCVLTDSNGEFQFTNVLPGKYEFKETVKPGWTQTCAPSPRCVKAGELVTGIVFCNKLDYECPCQTPIDQLVFAKYSAGWNMVAAPANTDLGLGPLWWYDPSTNAYQTFMTTTVGRGYWAYLQTEKVVAFKKSDVKLITFYLNVGWNMIGNSLTVPIDLPPAMTIVWWYDPAANAYKQVTRLESGQGAWVYSPIEQMVLVSGE